jgi:conjugal transfer pilus assembly protein TraE
MKFSLNLKHLSNLQKQRHFLLFLSAFLLATNLGQTTLLFFKEDKTIILPAELKQSFWVEGKRFSPSYLEEQGLYFAHLLLDVNEANILNQGEILLRYVAPQVYGDFKTKLLEHLARLKKDNLALHFIPVEWEVFPGSLQLRIIGDLQAYIGGKRITTHRKVYQVEFTHTAGRLFLKSFKCVKGEGTKEDLEESLSNKADIYA